MGARATRTARCASEKKRPKRSKEHFERSHAITPSAQPSRRPFRSAFSRNLATPHDENFAKAREKKIKKAIERIDANARDATTRRFRAQTETIRESRNRTRGTRRTYHCDFYRTRVWICLTKSGGKCTRACSSFFIKFRVSHPRAALRLHKKRRDEQNKTQVVTLKDKTLASRA
jgi:hypothetical protein